MGQAGGPGQISYSSLTGNTEAAARRRGASCHCHAKMKHADTTSLALKPRRKDVKNKVRSASHSWVFENTALIPFSPFSPVP